MGNKSHKRGIKAYQKAMLEVTPGKKETTSTDYSPEILPKSSESHTTDKSREHIVSDTWEIHPPPEKPHLLNLKESPPTEKMVLTQSAETILPPPMQFLKDIPYTQCVLLLRGESIIVKSLLLPALSPSTAARIITDMPPSERRKVLLRIANTSAVDNETIIKVSNALRNRLNKRSENRGILKHLLPGRKGEGILSQILMEMPESERERLLQGISFQSPNLGRTLSGEIGQGPFSPDRIRKTIASLSDAQIAILLDDADIKLKTLVTRLLPKKRLLGVASKIVSFRNMDEQGQERVKRNFVEELKNKP